MRKIAPVFWLTACLLGLHIGATAQTNALSFDGVNDYINIANSAGYNITTSTQFTIEAWIKTGAGGDMAILSKTDPAAENRGFEFFMSNGTLAFRWRESASAYYLYQTSGTFNDNNWHHVAFSCFPPSGTPGFRFIVDGVEVAKTGLQTPTSNTSNTNTLLVGIRHGGSMPFNGLMDELRFWNVARTVEQVAAGRGCLLSGNSTGLNLYYRFNQGTAGGANAGVTTCTDESANNLPGTLFNFALSGASSNWVDASATGVLKACNVPEVNAFSPTAAVPGSSITITGNQFNPTPASNIVHFGNVKATVTAASFTSLTVTVPQGSGYQPIQVTNTAGSFSGFSDKPFLPTYSPAKGGMSAADFSAVRSYATGTTPGSMQTGDMDGDGETDVVVVNRGSGTVSVFRNAGAGTNLAFADKTDLDLPATNANARSVAIGDLDRDGKPDLAVANYQHNSISIWKNTGTPGTVSFAARVDIAFGTSLSAIAITDINADGQPDVAFTSQGTNQLVVLRNIGAPGTISFAAPQTFASGSSPLDIVSGDFDGDGTVDIATLNGGSFNISVFRNTTPAAGTIQFAKTDFSVVGTVPLQFVTGDFDQNGKLDFAVSQFANNFLSVFANNSTPGSVSFAAKVDFALGNSPADIATGDLNGDGKPDIMIASPGANGLALLLNTGNASINFGTPFFVNTAANPYGVALCDVNQDNRTDLLTTAATANQFQVFENILPAPTISSIGPLVGQPGGTVVVQGTGFVANNPGAHQVFFGGAKANVTLSLLGNLLYVAAPPNATYENISLSVGGRTALSHKPYTNLFPGALPFSPNSFRFFDNYSAGDTPNDGVIADFNNDGRNDIVVTSGVGNTYTTFRNVPSGSTSRFVDDMFSSGGSMFYVDAADMDADGKLDLVGTMIAGIGICKNNSSGLLINFGSLQYFYAGANYINTAKAGIADFDGDGLPDIVLTSLSEAVVVVMRNVSFGGSFMFTPVFTFSLPANGGGVTVGDFNRDGRPDIAATSPNAGTVSIFTNTSGGRIMSFGTRADLNVGSNARAIRAVDLDNDDRLDLAVAHFNSGRISIWSNQSAQNGSISFAFVRDLIGHTAGSLVLETADLNGDGRPDLLVNGSLPALTLNAYINTSTVGNIQFDSQVKTLGGLRNLRAIVAGDLDGDMLPDLVSLIDDNQPFKVDLLLNHINEPFVSSLSTQNLAAGKEVVITGTGFTGATGVFFGNWPALSFTVDNDQQITAIVGGGGTGSVRVTNANASYTTPCCNLNVGFDPHRITSLDKRSAPAGSEVRIFGQNFLPNNTTDNLVYFGNTRAKVLSSTATEIKVEVPFGTTTDQPVSVAIYNRIVQAKERFSLSFSPAATLSPSLFASKTDLPLGTQANSLAIADFDNDGKPDVATASIAAGQVMIRLNTSTLNAFSLSTGITLATQSGPSPIVAHDMNGDGKIDLAVVNVFGNSISIFRNNSTPGNLAFVLVEHIAANTNPRSVHFADINGDARPEMLCVADDPQVFSLWRNTGIGDTIRLTNKTDYATGAGQYGITAAELGGLSAIDVVTANRGSGTGSSISVFRNISTLFNYSFEARTDITLSNQGGAFIPIAMDMDNSPVTFDDIIVSDALAGYISMFPNTSGNSSLTFGTRVDFNTGNAPSYLSQGNLNGDDRVDLAALGLISTSIALLPNTSANGVKSFGTQTNITGVATMHGIAIVDMNGDGRPDIVTANSNANSISIFKNSAPGIANFLPKAAAAARTVTITGNGLQNTTSVLFGGVPALRFTVVSPSEVQAVVGAGQSGNVSVVTNEGTYTMGGFEYIDAGNKLYVQAGSIALGEGQGWATPLPSLSDAIARANILPGVDSILVAAGTYYPTGNQANTNRDSALVISRGNLTILGGYNAATGLRNPTSFATIVSGNIGNAQLSTDNSYHLFVSTTASASPVTVDGLVLADANATGSSNFTYAGRSVPRNRGSAWHNDVQNAIRFVNCRVINNTSGGGGAIYTSAGSMRINQSVLEGNQSGFGGAIRAEADAQLFIVNNVFHNNRSNTGGGGAINNFKNGGAKDTLINNLFIRNRDANTSNLLAGGIALVNGQHYVANNTFYADSAVNNGGAVYINGVGTYELYNNIFYKNYAANGADVFITGSGVNYVQAGNSFGATDPLFINEGDADGPDNLWGTLDDGLRIDIGSPAMNAADPAKLPSGISTDVSGAPRIMFNELDQGAYEGLNTALHCPGTTLSYSITGTGDAYGWEINTGSGYQAISNGGMYSGATTPVLTISNATSQLAWAKVRGYRMVSGTPQYGPVRTISFGTVWNGATTEWGQAGNWSCSVPTTATTAIIPAGMPNAPTVGANGVAGGLILFPNANILMLENILMEIKK